jgi:hypothetical protein
MRLYFRKGPENPFKNTSGVAVNNLAAMTVTQADYVQLRVAAGIDWYRAAAVTTRAKYLIMRVIAVVGAALVPVFLNAFPTHALITTGISILVVLAVSLEGVLHYKEQWRNYSATSSALEHEFYAMKIGTPPYDTVIPEQMFNLFAQRVEDTINQEVSTTLNTVAGGTDTTVQTV